MIGPWTGLLSFIIHWWLKKGGPWGKKVPPVLVVERTRHSLYCFENQKSKKLQTTKKEK